MKRVIFLSLMALLFAGCYKTEIGNSGGSGGNGGDMVFNVDTPPSDAGESYTLVVDGEEITVGDDGTVTLPDDMAMGEYTAYVYNDPENTTIESSATDVIASVEVVSDGVVSGDAGILYFGKQTIVVSENGVTTTETEMVQITRELNFSLALDGDATNRIERVTALLEGVAQQWDCVNDQPAGDSYAVMPTLTQSTTPGGISATRADEASILTGKIYLLGVDPTEEQKLTITLEYKDANPSSSEIIVSDVSTQLKEFNSDKSTPLVLSGSVETPTSSSIEGNTIIDWSVNNKDDVTVK